MERLRPEDPESIGPWQIVGRLGAGGMGEVFIGKKSNINLKIGDRLFLNYINQ